MGKAQRAHHYLRRSLVVGTAQVRLCPPYISATTQFATSNPAVDETAVTNEPQAMSTTATGQFQCLSSASEVRSKVA